MPTARRLLIAVCVCAALGIATAAQQAAPVPTSDTADAPRAQDPEKKEPAWDVTAPLGGSTRTVAFDTDEGTWMNVDVSPDGRTIVFDLLALLSKLAGTQPHVVEIVRE